MAPGEMYEGEQSSISQHLARRLVSARTQQAVEQAAPLSLTLSRKGRGNPRSDAPLTQETSPRKQAR
ncbi:hypothetical protein JCM18382A_29440 [Bradyrhizobium sp. 17-4]